MDISNHKKEVMQVVKYILIMIIVTSFISCNKTHSFEKDNKCKIKIFKSKDGYSYINLRTFEFEDKGKRYHAIYQINGIIFSKPELNDFTPPILGGKYSIRVGAVSKQWSQIYDINIKKGDSIVIDFFLENDLTPLE